MRPISKATIEKELRKRLIRQIENAKYRKLVDFIKDAWPIIEPNVPYVHNWHIDACCEHLEAVSYGQITRLNISVPPGMMKSLMVCVFWPAWEWGVLGRAHYRYLGVSHSLNFSIRDAMRMRRLITSEWYQARWGYCVSLSKDQNAKTKFENTATGFREALAASSMTGSRGDRVLIDDAISVADANSKAVLLSTELWFKESVPTRLNHPKNSAIVIIAQRLHDLDVSGIAIEQGYDTLILPMEYEHGRQRKTVIGFEDPRKEEGELLFPERFPKDYVDKLKLSLGEFGTACQLQQNPVPRDGGVIKKDWLNYYDLNYPPPFLYIIQAWDTAFKDGEQNDFSCCLTWGVAQIGNDYKWYLIDRFYKKVLYPELEASVIRLFDRYNPHFILIEDKASGQSIIQSMRFNQARTRLPIKPIKVDRDKVSRLAAASGVFESRLVYLPQNAGWLKDFVYNLTNFPAAAHDDDVDCTSMPINYMISLKQSNRRINQDVLAR